MVIARLSLGLSFLGLRNFLKLCHDEKPCTWWLGEKGLGSLQSRLARMLHHEYDALKGYRFLGGAISFYSVSCMSDVIFNPSLLNWSSLILTVAHMYIYYLYTNDQETRPSNLLSFHISSHILPSVKQKNFTSLIPFTAPPSLFPCRSGAHLSCRTPKCGNNLSRHKVNAISPEGRKERALIEGEWLFTIP